MDKNHLTTFFPKLKTLFIMVFLFTGCTLNGSDQPQTSQITPTTTLEENSTTNGNSAISPCELVSVEEMEEIFLESPLFFSEENGGCVVRNQWGTRSIWFMVAQGEQAFSAMRWHTNHLVKDWPTDNLRQMANEIINDENNQTIDTLQLARLPLFEELEFRWERLFTFGDVSYWIIDPRAFKGVFDVVEDDIYFQLGYSGFLAAKIQPSLEDLSAEIFTRLPDQFLIDYDFSIDISEGELAEVEKPIPQVIGITKTSEIFFGSLCGEETTTIRVFIENADTVDNVYLVYRLESNLETNDNWTTIFMNQLTSDNWEVTIDAEKSFLTYELVNGALIEYSVAIIYEVNKVVRTPNFRDIVVYQCQQ